MARVFTAGVSGVVSSGGACYWFLVIKPNAGDSWTKIAIGTLTANSLSGYSVQAGRLLSIGDIDNKADVYGDPLALSPDVDFTVQNIALDFVPTAYVGREVELRFGSGETMTDATSDVMFTGKIYGYKTNKIGEIVFTVRGLSQLANKPVGIRIPADVDEKYRGKIYPMTWGDYSGTDDFAPVVLNRAKLRLPDVVGDTEQWEEFDSIHVFDTESGRDFRAKQTGGLVLNDELNTAYIVSDDSLTLTADMAELDTEVSISSYSEIETAFTSQSVILKIEDELMLVLYIPNVVDGYAVNVERGYFGTTQSSHASGTPVYIAGVDLVSGYIAFDGIFYPRQIYGMVYTSLPLLVGSNKLFPTYPESGEYENIILNESDPDSLENNLVLRWGFTHLDNAMPRNLTLYYIKLIFEKIGIDADVSDQYVIGKFSASAYGNTLNGLYFEFITSTNPGTSKEGVSVTNNSSTYLIKEVKAYSDYFIVYCTRTSGTNDPSGSVLLSVAPPFTIIFTGWNKSQSGTYLILGKSGGSETSLLSCVAENTETPDEQSFDNMTSAATDEETDIDVVSKISNVNELESAGYQIKIALQTIAQIGSVHEVDITKIAFRIGFNADIIKYDFWARCKGRVDPGGGITGVEDELIENPANLIENFINTADNGGAIAECDITGFYNSYTDRASWKLAYSVYAKDSTLPKFRDEINKMLSCSGLICFEKYDGTLGLATLDAPDEVTRFVTDDEIKIDSALMADVDFGSIDTSILITAIEVKYRTVLPVDDKYAGVVYCNHTGSDISNFTDDINEYSGYLATAYDALGEDRPYTVEAPCIRDAATAELLAKLIIKLRYKALEQITIRGSYSLLDIEIGDKIGMNSTLLASTGLNDKTYIVTGMRIQPNVNKVKPDVRLTLTELGTATITERTIWQDSASAPTNIKTDVASGGRVIMEV